MRALLPTSARQTFLTVCGLAVAILMLTLAGTQARADVQDFRYESWAVDYEIGVDNEGRAEARVTETITAVFPDHDQNRGIVRGIPNIYEGARVNPKDFQVTNAAGDPIPFETESEDGFTAVLTGDNSYVHGPTSYVISYSLSDVVLSREDGAADEFYWDIMDFEHAQPVGSFSASISFDATLGRALNGAAHCYVGAAGSTEECDISRSSGDAMFAIPPTELAPGEGVTVALGLEAGAVTQPPSRHPSFVFDTLPIIIAGAALVLGVTATAFAVRMRRRRRLARGTIIAQYDVPAALPPLIAAAIAETSPHPVPAEIVHLAVRGAIRIETSENQRGERGSSPQPTLRLMDASRAADPLDEQTIKNIFGSSVAGSGFTIPGESDAFATQMTELRQRGKTEAVSRGYFERAHSATGRALGAIGVVISAVALIFSFVAVGVRDLPSGFVALAVFVGFAALVLSIVGIASRRVHTRLGAEAREYLMGVREFIRVAEADRLDMLQSYAGAERTRIGGSAADGTEVVAIYERLLPYAMIFGLQKEWTRALEAQYEQTANYTPLWLMSGGLGVASIAGMGDTLSSFTSSLNSAASYTSSSSGGSTGGGFAGGGGGGGFSGGR